MGIQPHSDFPDLRKGFDYGDLLQRSDQERLDEVARLLVDYEPTQFLDGENILREGLLKLGAGTVVDTRGFTLDADPVESSAGRIFGSTASGLGFLGHPVLEAGGISKVLKSGEWSRIPNLGPGITHVWFEVRFDPFSKLAIAYYADDQDVVVYLVESGGENAKVAIQTGSSLPDADEVKNPDINPDNGDMTQEGIYFIPLGYFERTGDIVTGHNDGYGPLTLRFCAPSGLIHNLY